MMKRIALKVLAVFLAVLTGILLPLQASASTPLYISEVKIGMGKTAEEAKAALAGYSILDVDLNQGAGGGLGSKGEKAVYLGYKTTTKQSEAITDLALMNMKGGYSVQDYEYLMNEQMKAQIIPLVDGFLATINEYRQNYEAGVQRALYIHDILNKFLDDDTGMGLGDLLLSDTVYEIAKPQWDALSAEVKEKTTLYQVNKQVRDSLPAEEKHADILTILAQSNGKATLMMQNLLTRAADPNDSTWLERFSEISYDDLVDSTGMAPTDAEKQLAKLYDDGAIRILEMWDDFSSELLTYDEAVQRVENYDSSKYEAALQAMNELNDDTSIKEATRILDAFEAAQNEMLKIKADIKTIALHDTLEEIEYLDGTMLDFFTTDASELTDDITTLYPLVASFTAGQRAGMEFISLKEMLVVALTDEDGYSDADLDEISEISIYDGVDREIYSMGAVALTSDALRAKAYEEREEERSMFSGWSITMMAVTGASFLAMTGSAISWGVYANRITDLKKVVNAELDYYRMAYDYPFPSRAVGEVNITTWQVEDIYRDNPEWKAQMDSLTSKSRLCKGLTIGFGVAMVILAAVTTYLTWQDMQAYYHVDYTAIPRYMVDEKDLIGYNRKGEKIILKNQSAYYKAVACNRTAGNEFYDVLGTCADVNGDVGKQWLALYAVKNEIMEPILASSLKVVVDSTEVPAGYQTGIHMFGADVAFNLNSSLYDWANDAPSVYVYFQTDDTAPSTAGTSFSGGTLALTGGSGIALGAAVCALAMKKKKPDLTADQSE